MKQWLWRALAGLGVCLLLVLGRVEAGSGADDHLGVACWGWSVDVRGGPALASPAAAPAKNRGPRQARAAAPESLGVDCVLLTERGVGPPWLDSRGPPGSAGDPGRPQLPARPVAQGRGEVWIRTHAAGFPAPKRGVLQQPLASRRILSLEPVRLKNPADITAPMISRRKRTRGSRRSSRLRFQVFGVETRSFLPDDQNDRCDLACQGETSHRRLHPLGQQTFVKLVQRSGGTARPHRRALENPFEIVVVVLI